jgi:hypothetical protein
MKSLFVLKSISPYVPLSNKKTSRPRRFLARAAGHPISVVFPYDAKFTSSHDRSVWTDRRRIVLQKVTWATDRIVRISGLSARWTGIEIGLLRIATGVRAETRRQRVDESATTAALATSAATSAANAAPRRTTISPAAITQTAVTQAMAVVTKATTVAQGTAIGTAAIGATSIRAAAIAAAWIAAFFAFTTWVTNAALGFATNVATTTRVAAALAGESAVRTAACRQAEHGNHNHELFHQKSP